MNLLELLIALDDNNVRDIYRFIDSEGKPSLYLEPMCFCGKRKCPKRIGRLPSAVRQALDEHSETLRGMVTKIGKPPVQTVQL